MCTVEKRGAVFILTLTGDTEHRLSPSFIAEIRAAVAGVRSEALASPGRFTALVTAAHGRFFSNGFDVAHAVAAPTSAERAARLHSMVDDFAPLVADLVSLPMPTVAAVTGHAAAAGMMLALAHDFVVMRGDRGVLYLPEMEMGLPFPPYFLAIMRERVKDPRVSKDMLLRARRIGAKEAAEAGIVDLVKGSAEETAAAALAMADEFVKKKWVGKVYASIRMGSIPGICRAVGLREETETDRRSMTTSKL